MKSLHLSPSGALKKGWIWPKKHFIVMLGLVLGYMVLLWVISLLSGADTTTFRYWILYFCIESGFVCVGQCGIR